MSKNKITAVLGPTNTGKTFLAIETMLSFDTGMIGFPLRLLAREVYDKIVQKVDASKVALITGEEKIIPINAKYFLEKVDASAVFHNTSTRFNDGFELGLGAEVAVSTDKLHARGPMGINDLMTYKWVVLGQGQVRT